ncbi:MAG: DNA repair protein RadA [Armatimonadota bacterium]|nr:DNA repair protein RadA [Armatimonadota bacterium]MDR5696697.1 DNA repair protein RadA [Armatimonadota bacterium]
MKIRYICQACGYESPKWLGRCPGCDGWNTFAEEAAVRTRAVGRTARPVPILEVEPLPYERLPTGIGELDRVLGGGIVPASMVLVGGEPGAGKSTLMLQASDRLASAGHTVLYVAGEESPQQTRMRAERIGATSPRIYVVAETDLGAVLEAARRLRPAVMVVDSIQTVYLPDVPSSPGSVGQVRECAAALLRLSKAEGIAAFVVGHVTKEGAIAGPRVLEHIVDTVLYFEGERHQAYRVLRAIKNRFGSTNEIGVFEMQGTGLREVPNPSAAFVTPRPEGASGAAVVCAIEGTRPLLVEVQALVAPTPFGTPRRTTAGLDYNRLLLLLAVLERHAGLAIGQADVYVNAVGGVRIADPAADLGVALAVASSLRDRALDPQALFCGEVGLSGEVRAVPQIARRLAEGSKLGFRMALVPESSLPVPGAGTLRIVGVQTIAQALDLAPWRPPAGEPF